MLGGEAGSAHDETSSSGHKDDEEGSEDESEELRIDALAHDPERLKAFNVSIISNLIGCINSNSIKYFLDVRATVCGREFRSHGAYIKAAKRKDPGYYRFMYTAIS